MRAAPKKAISENLDLLRAVAVLCVYFSHLTGTMHDRNFGSLGRLGVILFFVHTSFVLMASMERLDQTAESSFRLALGFWIRRIFRIYPLAILFVVLVAVAHVPYSPVETYRWIGERAFLSNLALTQNLTYSPDILSPLWSLPLEVQMYALLPLVYVLVRGGRRHRSAALWVLSVLLALTVPRLTWRLNVFLYAPCFMAGVLAYDLKRRRSERGRLPAWVWPLSIVAAIAIYGPHDDLDLGGKIVRAWAVALMLGLVYAHVDEVRVPVVQPVLHWIAEHSYGVYLSHMVLFWIVFERMAGWPIAVKILILLTGSIGVPALLYVAVEQPLVRVGARVAKHVLRLHAQRRLLSSRTSP